MVEFFFRKTRNITPQWADIDCCEVRKSIKGPLDELERVLLRAGALGETLGGCGLTVSVAESCTGGMLGQLLTAGSGASRFFAGGVISYSNHLKEQLLGVPARLLKEYGAVSEQCAGAMASGIVERTGADCSIAITGIAGPGGGSPEKPVGTVCIAVFCGGRVYNSAHRFRGSRERIRLLSALAGMELLMDVVKED